MPASATDPTTANVPAVPQPADAAEPARLTADALSAPDVFQDAGAEDPASATGLSDSAPPACHAADGDAPFSATVVAENAPAQDHVACGDVPDSAVGPGAAARRRIGTPLGPSRVSRVTVRGVCCRNVPDPDHVLCGAVPDSAMAPRVNSPATAHVATADDPDSVVGARVVSSNAKKRPAVSPMTASVGLLVSPVDVLMRCSARAIQADALFRLRIASAQLVKLVLCVIAVVLFAALPQTRR